MMDSGDELGGRGRELTESPTSKIQFKEFFKAFKGMEKEGFQVTCGPSLQFSWIARMEYAVFLARISMEPVTSCKSMHTRSQAAHDFAIKTLETLPDKIHWKVAALCRSHSPFVRCPNSRCCHSLQFHLPPVLSPLLPFPTHAPACSHSCCSGAPIICVAAHTEGRCTWSWLT